ncbi:uncharacterized protein cubi_02929 [Cryptosporidium ubiquitum]|uniref:NUP210 Ig-like domain-containing protein n=1 Tax=Cryptosporidium ubiquitum TaxID=857276 RepID=A0A1J4MJE1_9CRYT|nr:uncharacterized protein cubi_02929 [Cryptosporidium ubiquitum]OII74127.1 hypothetical protein cubi_02929 [Cryptosporidium ubiquitum]
MLLHKEEYIILFVIIFLYFNSFLCVSSNSRNKIDPALALLPWTLNNKSNIEIRVNHGCYNWKFEEDEFLTVNSLVVRTDDFGNNCTDVVNVNPRWPYMHLKGIFTMIAYDIYTGENLRSEIHIAKVESIKISTSSKRIRLGSLENLYAVGFDNEFNTFTSLNGLKIVWELENDNIKSEKNDGSQILVIGSKVGSVNVYVKIVEDDYTLISSSVTIYVEDPFKIIPHVRRAPFGSLYPIHLVKEGSVNNLGFFKKEFHYCEIDQNSEAEAQVFEGSKLIIGNYNNQDTDAEFIISTTCKDRRVDGSSFTNIVYSSFPKGILFAVQDELNLAAHQDEFNFNNFAQLYFIEGEQLVERSGFFDIILQNNELTIVEKKTIFLQLKLFNHKREFLDVPINSNFDFSCRNGCNSVSIIPFQSEDYENKSNNGFFKIVGNSVGFSELVIRLNSIGDMNYSELNRNSKLSEITSSLKINIVKDISTLFLNLPVILYPGEQEINIRENITGGKGPFFFCSSNSSIAMVDFHTGLLKTNYITGMVSVIVYDTGTSHYNFKENNLDCESLKYVYGYNIPVLVAYINGFNLELLSSNSSFYNNTIYTSISQRSLSIEIKAEPLRDLNALLDNQYESSFYSHSFNNLDTLDILKLFNPCRIVEAGNLLEFQSNFKSKSDLSINDCLLIIDDLKIAPYSQLASNYDSNTIQMDINEQKINIELKKHGSIVFESFIEFGVEIFYNSKIIKRKILNTGLSIYIFQEISFIPIINEIVLSYFESSETPSNNFFIEKSSKITFSLQGGLIDYQEKTNFLIEYSKFKLFLLINDEEREIVGTQKEINNHHSIQISQLDEINKFLLECNGEPAVGFIKFSMMIFDEYQSEVYRMKSLLKVFCKSIDHINMFWVNRSPIIGKYTCNTRNDNCMVFHFNSKKKHRFISLAYDKNNNLILSFNRFKSKWEIQNISEFSIDFVGENEQIDKNIIDLFINLGTEYNMKDVNIKFEVFISNQFDENNQNDDLTGLSIITKGIFTRPPVLISPYMLNRQLKLEDYHQFENESDGINFIGSWNLLEGMHQFGIIHGTNNFNVFTDEKYVIEYSFCKDKMQSEDSFLIENKFSDNSHDIAHIFPFCLDSKNFSSDIKTKKINIYIEDKLIIPKYLIKKELVFNNLNRLHLVWLDRINLGEINKESSSSPWVTYFTYDNASDHKNGHLNSLKIPRQYISFSKIDEYINYFESNQRIDNHLPCVKWNCLVDDKSRSILVVIMYDAEGVALEPWQNSEFKIEIEYRIKNSFYDPNLEFEEQIKNGVSDFSIEIRNLSSTTFQIMEIKQKNIDIEFFAKIIDLNSDILMHSNSLSLKVYESIELEPNADTFSLLPYGTPLHIIFKGGPGEFQNTKLEWNIQLEKNAKDKVHKEILLIRDKKKLIIEPLGTIGKERVSIKCFLTNENEDTKTFKTLLFSKLIDIYVDVPNEIDVFSPEKEYLYLGYPKVYRLRTWKTDETRTLQFHHSQYFPSGLTNCRTTWSISQNLNEGGYNSVNSESKKCDFHSNLVCISRFTGRRQIDRFKINNFLGDFTYSNISMYDYTVLLYPKNIGISYLKVRLNCNFGYKEKIELEYTQKLNILKAINSVENGIWVIKDSFYYFNIPKEVFVKTNSTLDIEYLNNSQLVYLNTWKSNETIVFFNEEKRFEPADGSIITVSPIIISDSKVVLIEFDKYDDYSVMLSLFFFNSMGVRLFPSPNYCYGLSLHLIPVKNGNHNFFVKAGSNILIYLNGLFGNRVFEESSLNENCQFILKQNPENKPLMLIEEINSWRLMDSESDLYKNSSDSCFIIQIYSNRNRIIGSQPFCLKLNAPNHGKYNEHSNYINTLNIGSINNSIFKTKLYEFEVFAGSILHLNPIKWKALNSTPDKLNFCVIVDNLRKDLDMPFKEELSKILNIPLKLINITYDQNIQSKLFDHLNISSSNKQLVCISINQKIDPFELWVILMKYSSIISKFYGIFWVGMNEKNGINSSRDYNSEYHADILFWELLTNCDSAKIIGNELLAIPLYNSIKYIRLRLKNLIEIHLKVIPINAKFPDEDFIIVNKKYDKLHINTQFSFSIYFDGNEIVNKFFNNIYYSSPIIDVTCEVYDPILKKIYSSTPYWSLTVLNNPLLLPSCNMDPRYSDLSREIRNSIMSNYYTRNFIYILPKVTKTTFNITIESQSSGKLKRSVPIHFYPILIKSQSSSLFLKESTFIRGLVDDFHQIKIVFPFNSKNDYKFPIQIWFWFGYRDAKLITYTIRDQLSNEYILNFTPSDLQGEIKISRNRGINEPSSFDSNIILPLDILFEFISNEQKHQINIIFENKNSDNTKKTEEKVISRYFDFSKSIKVIRYLYMIFTPLVILSISIFYFMLSKKQVIAKETNSSPFRKLNTQKW